MSLFVKQIPVFMSLVTHNWASLFLSRSFALPQTSCRESFAILLHEAEHPRTTTTPTTATTHPCQRHLIRRAVQQLASTTSKPPLNYTLGSHSLSGSKQWTLFFHYPSAIDAKACISTTRYHRVISTIRETSCLSRTSTTRTKRMTILGE